jgi:hypothetical protein
VPFGVTKEEEILRGRTSASEKRYLYQSDLITFAEEVLLVPSGDTSRGLSSWAEGQVTLLNVLLLLHINLNYLCCIYVSLADTIHIQLPFHPTISLIGLFCLLFSNLVTPEIAFCRYKPPTSELIRASSQLEA